MDKQAIVSEVLEDLVRDYQAEFRGVVRTKITRIDKLTSQIEVLQKELADAQREFAELEYKEPKTPDLG
jgi:hypothetical protein